MSGTVRAGLIFGVGALLASIGCALILVIFPFNLILGAISVIALGWGAGYCAAKWMNTEAGKGLGRGAAAGAIAGTIVLIGTVVAFLILSAVISRIPGFEQAVTEAMQQNPNAGDVQLDPGALGTMLSLGFGILGFCGGLLSLLFMVVAGMIGGAMWKGSPATPAYVPAGGSAGTLPAGSYIPSQTSTYGSQTDSDSGARVYDADDPNRPR